MGLLIWERILSCVLCVPSASQVLVLDFKWFLMLKPLHRCFRIVNSVLLTKVPT